MKLYLRLLILLVIISSCQKGQYVIQKSTPYASTELNEEFTDDLEIQQFIAPYKDSLEEVMNVVIGHAEIDLGIPYGQPQTLLGNFVVDLIYSESYSKGNIKPDFSVMNHDGGLRVPIQQGEISVGDVFEVMPFENYVLLVELKGTGTQKLFDYCATTRKCSFGNATYVIENDKAIDIYINQKEFDVNSNYVLAISDYLVNGGAGFPIKNDHLIKEDFDYKLRDMIVNHIKNLESRNEKSYAELDDRVRVKTN